jgi:hypothetical protein
MWLGVRRTLKIASPVLADGPLQAAYGGRESRGRRRLRQNASWES